MISTTYFKWAVDNDSTVRIKTKTGFLQGKIKRVWWDDYEDRMDFVCESGVVKQIGSEDILELDFL